MIVTTSISVVAVSEPAPVEYVDIECSPGTIPVDCNNIQTTPLKLKALHRSGGSSAPYEVFWKLNIQSVGTELGTAESPGAMSEWEYMLPSDKWGNADSVVVEAYQDSSYKTLLSQKSVGISRQNPSPFPVEGDWKPLPFKYKNGEYFLDKETGFIYMWMNPVPGNSEIHPFYDVQQNPLTTSWKQHQEYPLLGTQLLLARKIDADLINADGITAKNVDIEGKITATSGSFTGDIVATSGRIGNWKIEGGDIVSYGSDARMRVEASGTRFMRINAEPSIMCSIRSDGSTALNISTYGDYRTRGLTVRANGYGLAIESFGAVEFKTRSTEYVRLGGLAVNVKEVSGSYTVDTSDDFIVVNNTSDVNLYLGSSIRGKIIYVKRMGNRRVTITGKIVYQDRNTVVTSLILNDQVPRMFIYDGDRWYEYAGRF